MSAEGIESSEKDIVPLRIKEDDTEDVVDGGKELESVFDEGDGDEVGATISHMGLIAGDKILMYPARKIKFGKVKFNPFTGVFNNFTGNIASKFVDDFGGGGGFGAKVVSFP